MQTLSDSEVQQRIAERLDISDFSGKRVLLIVPDATRTAPLPLLFEAVHGRLSGEASQVDVLVALGTHPAMPEEAICRLLGISADDRAGRYASVGLFNHEWDNPERLATIGELTKKDVEEISGGLLSLDVPVQINSRIRDYDVLLVMGPVFPHEVVGFSGGNKYFFPGISGPELLNFFHWLGALITNVGIIGVKDTPVRRVVNRAAELIPNQKRALTFVVNGKAEIYDLFYDTPENAWESAADVSSQVHINRVPKPFKQILSCAPPMYDELWVAGKCMYKLEPIVADGGELIIYAPHMSEISITHGDLIRVVGYHVRDYFTKQWDRFKDYPWGILAHSTHVRGTGTYKFGIERPRVNVTIASQIPRDVCESINLGYRDPATIDVESFANREDEGILLVRKAGEQLYRLADE
ncbi:MAG: lactate racemase domain-containing protein [Planctomycetota bacterium]|nr:lactate racemase domain-containing protein [Planctomycetota bacterium]MDA1251472.1 lactate racemase domain-containing protein [Planctomycetota bacterium]